MADNTFQSSSLRFLNISSVTSSALSLNLSDDVAVVDAGATINFPSATTVIGKVFHVVKGGTGSACALNFLNGGSADGTTQAILNYFASKATVVGTTLGYLFLNNQIDLTTFAYLKNEVTVNNGVTTAITFDKVRNGIGLSTSNGRFVAPMDGLYPFYSQIRITTEGNSPSSITLFALINGTGSPLGKFFIKSPNTTAVYTGEVTGFARMTAGDYLAFFAQSVSFQIKITGDPSEAHNLTSLSVWRSSNA